MCGDLKRPRSSGDVEITRCRWPGTNGARPLRVPRPAHFVFTERCSGMGVSPATPRDLGPRNCRGLHSLPAGSSRRLRGGVAPPHTALSGVMFRWDDGGWYPIVRGHPTRGKEHLRPHTLYLPGAPLSPSGNQERLQTWANVPGGAGVWRKMFPCLKEGPPPPPAPHQPSSWVFSSAERGEDFSTSPLFGCKT